MKKILYFFFWAILIFTFLYFPKWIPEDKEEKSVNILAWGGLFLPETIAEFEKKTGIKVYINYFSSNEELIVKLKATEGKGYDLITPSDYAVSQLIKEELLTPLNHQKLPYSIINSGLLNHSFDPENRYSIPYEWETYGLAMDQEILDQVNGEVTWDLIYQPEKLGHRIVMLNDPIQVLTMTSSYLFGPVSSLTPTQVKQIRRLLTAQKKWVELYTETRSDFFLATKSARISLATSSDMIRALTFIPSLRFVIPKENRFATIENFAIPKNGEHREDVYAFINYFLEKETLTKNSRYYKYFPASKEVIPHLNLPPDFSPYLQISEEELNRFHFVHPILSQIETLDLWVKIKQ